VVGKATIVKATNELTDTRNSRTPPAQRPWGFNSVSEGGLELPSVYTHLTASVGISAPQERSSDPLSLRRRTPQCIW